MHSGSIGSLLVVASLCQLASLSNAAARVYTIPLRAQITEGASEIGEPVLSYFAQIGLGTPQKQFLVQFDTDLSDIFVPHYERNPFKSALHYSKGYLAAESSTSHRTGWKAAILYQQCRIEGKIYQDNLYLSLDSYRAIGLRQSFIGANYAEKDTFRYLPVDGFVGLSPADLSSTQLYENLITSLLKGNIIDNKQFSIWFNPTLDSHVGGELILGGQDPRRYQGQIHWNRLISNSQWAIQLDRVMLGAQHVGCIYGNCRAVLKSGINNILGPRQDVDNIYRALQVSVVNQIPYIDCRRIPQVPYMTFSFGGTPITILPSNFIRKITTGTIFKEQTCYLTIQPLAGSNEWVLGTSFLGSYYTIFDASYQQVGFATLRL